MNFHKNLQCLASILKKIFYLCYSISCSACKNKIVSINVSFDALRAILFCGTCNVTSHSRINQWKQYNRSSHWLITSNIIKKAIHFSIIWFYQENYWKLRETTSIWLLIWVLKIRRFTVAEIASITYN